MMGNPLQMLMQAAQMGRDTMAMLQQMAGSNPQAAQAMRLMQGKTPQQLQQIATNMAQQMGTTPEAIAQSLGLSSRR